MPRKSALLLERISSGRPAPTRWATGPGRVTCARISIHLLLIPSFAHSSPGRKSPAGFRGLSPTTKRRHHPSGKPKPKFSCHVEETRRYLMRLGLVNRFMNFGSPSGALMDTDRHKILTQVTFRKITAARKKPRTTPWLSGRFPDQISSEGMPVHQTCTSGPPGEEDKTTP